MHFIVSDEQLVQIIHTEGAKHRLVSWLEDFRRDAWSGGHFTSHGAGSADWSHVGYHARIGYLGDLIHVKAMTRIGSLANRCLCFADRYFEGGYRVHQSADDSIRQESGKYRVLQEEGFATLQPMQHLIENAGITLVDGVLLTREEFGYRNLRDVLEEDTDLSLLEQASELMRQLHDIGEAWGDAKINNFMVQNNTMILFDFGFKTAYKDPTFLNAKDVVHLLLHAVYVTGLPPEEVMPAMLAAYNPDVRLRDELGKQMEEDLRPRSLPFSYVREKLYYKLQFGMGAEQVHNAKRTLLDML